VIINAQAEAEKNKIEAGGEAAAITLKQNALAQNPLIIQYEFVQKLSPNITWGILPDGVVPIHRHQGASPSSPALRPRRRRRPRFSRPPRSAIALRGGRNRGAAVRGALGSYCCGRR